MSNVEWAFPHGQPTPSRLSRQVGAYRLPQSCNLEGMSMNIQLKNSAHHFCIQSECEQTLVSMSTLWDGLISLVMRLNRCMYDHNCAIVSPYLDQSLRTFLDYREPSSQKNNIFKQLTQHNYALQSIKRHFQ